MRNKIKQLLKKEGGFTLIELLGVIVILGIILAISIPLMGNVIKNAETATEKSQKELVVDAAQMYFLQAETTGNTVTTSKLVSEGFLEEKPGKTTTEYTVTKGTDNKYTVTGGAD